MFTGTTIDELMNMVERAEANADTYRIEELKRFTPTTLNVYSFEQFKSFERETALVGVA